MKTRLSKRIVCLAAVAMMFVTGIFVDKALAYFTTYVVAQGGKTLDMGFSSTELDEKVIDGKKIVVVKNTGTADCFVRVKVFAATDYKDLINVDASNHTDWIVDNTNKVYEYSKVLVAGGETSSLSVEIGALDTDKNTSDFNVIVIQESTPVLYDKDGNTYADWSGSKFDIETK